MNGETARENRLIAVLIAIAVLELWFVPARSSFWLDETATFWIVKDGFANVVARAFSWSGQSPLYYLTAWIALLVAGSSEFVLRIPSMLATAAGAWLIFKLAARLFDTETARFALLTFICIDQVVFAAVDARPYALSLCLLTAAALAIVYWLDTGRTLYGIGFAFFAALTVYGHTLFAIGLVAPGIYALYRVVSERRVKFPMLIGIFALTALLLAPLAAQLVNFYRGRTSHSFSQTPHFGDLLLAFAPPILAASMALGFLIAWWKGAQLQTSGNRQTANVFLAAGWIVIPPLVCYLISILTETKLFLPRYYGSNAPGVALLSAWVVRCCIGGAARRIMAAAIGLGAIVSFGSMSHGGEDWRGAMQSVRSTAGNTGMPVLAASGFVEASDIKTLEDPAFREILFAPFTIYPAAGDLIRLPFKLDETTEPFIENLVSTRLQREQRFLFIAELQGLSFEPWLRGRLAPLGFQSKSLGDFGLVRVFLFSRGPSL